VMDPAVLDSLIDGRRQAAVAVGHDAHVVVVDRAVVDRDVIGLVDPHSGAIVTLVVRAEELEAFQHAPIGALIKLEDGARDAADSLVVEALAGDRHPAVPATWYGAERQDLLPNADGRLLVGPAILARMNEDHVAVLGVVVGLFNPVEPLVRPYLQRSGRRR